MRIVKQFTSDFFTVVFTIFCLVFSLGQLQRIQLAGDAAFYVHDLLVTLFVAGFIWQQKKITNKKEKINNFYKKYRLEILFFIWLILGMVLGFFSNRINLKSFLYLARIIDYSLFIYALNKIKLTYQPYLGILFAGSLIGFWGLIQYLIMPDMRYLNIFGWDNHYYRLISTIFDPAFTGIILVLMVGLWQRLSNLKFTWLIQILLTVAIAATFSRASYLAFSFLAFTQWLTTKQKLKWLVIGLIFLLTITLLPKPGGEGVNLARTSTIEARSENIQENLITLKNGQWLWGRGLFNNDAQKTSYTNNHAQLPDNIIVLIINSSGLIGLSLALILAIKWLRIFYTIDKLWTILIMAVLIHSLFNNTLLQPFVFLSLFSSKKTTT